MKILKYIINSENIPILFSRKIMHNTILQEVKSAGFVHLNHTSDPNQFIVKCFGESTTLKLESNPEVDKKLIEDFLNGK